MTTTPDPHVKLLELRQAELRKQQHGQEISRLLSQTSMVTWVPLHCALLGGAMLGLFLLVALTDVKAAKLAPLLAAVAALQAVPVMILAKAIKAQRRLIELEAPDLHAKLRGHDR